MTQETGVYGPLGDIRVVKDYNGDSKDEIAVFRPSSGTWHIYGMLSSGYGQNGDIPLPANYNGFGPDDVALLRP